MRCAFCATGKGGFARNLKAHEILDQVRPVTRGTRQLRSPDINQPCF